MYLVDFICVIPRQAREIVLRYEGRLTRTRGYQTAGADVRPPAFFVFAQSNPAGLEIGETDCLMYL